MTTVSIQKIQFEARVAGRIIPRVLEVSSSAGFDQINAEATIWTTARPSWVDETQDVTIWGSNGTHSRQIFGGEVVGIDWTYAPEKIGIICRDLLARTRLEWGGGEYIYSNQDDAAIIRNLLEKMGIPSSVARIESSAWTLAVVEDIILADGDVPYSIIEEIDNLAGYKTFSLTTGTILRQRVSGIPGAGSALSFSKGVTILSDAKRNRSRDGIINHCVVTGLDYEGLTVGGPGVGEWSAENAYIPNPPGYVTEKIQSNLVEDDAKALEIAKRTVADKNRRPEGITFSVPFEPRVQPGMTVTVTHGSLETGTATVFVQNVAHSLSSSGARTTIRTTGGNLSGYALASPIPNFTVQLFLEGEDTGAGVNGLVVGVCDATGSFDPDGSISTYAWTASGAGDTPAPASGSSSIFRFTVSSAATEIVITLTVTDNDGQTGVMALTVPIDTSTMLVEDLYLAYGNVACSSDGEQTWRTATPASGSAICLAAFAPDWGEVWGTTTGHIYATFDKLKTTLIDLGQPNSTADCTALWVHEQDQTRLWAGFDDGKVYFATVDIAAHTATFALMGTVPGGSIVEIRESYGLLGELRATAGAGYYYSPDSGANWTLVHTFDTAWRMAAGFDQNMATGLNDAAPIYGETTTPTVPGGVLHLRGITFGWRTQALYATDDTAALYTTDSTFAAFTAHADTLNAIGNHMIRSGNIDGPVIYSAIGDGTGVNNGFQKWIPDIKAPFYIRKTTAAKGYMIGFGPLHLPDVPVTLFMPSWGGAGATDKLWKYIPGTGWTGLTNPQTGWFWFGIARSVHNSSHLLMWGNNVNQNTTNQFDVDGVQLLSEDGTATPLYRSINGGTSWTAITLSTNQTRCDGPLFVSWSDSVAGEFYCAMELDTPIGNERVTLWRGSAGSSSAAAVYLSAASSNQDTWGLIDGLNGDVVITATPASNNPQNFGYVAAGTSVYTPIGGDLNVALTHLERLPFTSPGVLARDGADVYVTMDYRTGAPANQIAQAGTSLAAMDGNVVFVGGNSGVYKISNILSSPTTALEASTTGINIGWIRAGRRIRTSAAGRIGGSINVLIYLDGSWTTLPGPSAASSATLSDWIEIVD